MGILYETIKRPNLHQYAPEYNPDGTEKHIVCDGARYHVISYVGGIGAQCSEKNCEINKRYNVKVRGRPHNETEKE